MRLPYNIVAHNVLVTRGVLQKNLRIDIEPMLCYCKIHEVEGLEDIKYFQDGKAAYFSFPPHLSAYGHFLVTYYIAGSYEPCVGDIKFSAGSYKTFVELFDKLSAIDVNNKPIFAADDALVYIQNSHAFIIDDKHHDLYYARRAAKKCQAYWPTRR